MKLISPKVEIIPQGEGLLGIYKQIEIAGRTCYKSEDKITDTSCEEFVQRMIDNGHTAMLEHGTVYLAIPITTGHSGGSEINYMNNKYSIVTESEGLSMRDEYNDPCDCWCVTTNLRVLVENGWMDDLKYYLCEPTQWHVKRVCVRFICDRGVSHELVRHRVFSFAQESTRYCNYSKGKFGGEITCIKPTWYDASSEAAQEYFKGSLWYAEDAYLAFLDSKYTPQQARQLLPTALKTEVVMTGFMSDWKKFLELRTAPNAHPDMQYLAKELKKLLIEQNLYD